MTIPPHETLISLGQAARGLPRRRGRRPVHVSTLYRWRRVGLLGVRLEAVKVGGTWCTTREAIRRFFDCLTEIAAGSGATHHHDVVSGQADIGEQLDSLLGRDDEPSHMACDRNS